VRSKFKKTIVLNALLFIGGFSTVFISFGASASLIGQVFITYQDLIRQIGGIVIVIFGLYLLGVLNISFLKMEHRFQFRNRPVGYVGSFLIGVAFAAGWTPCVGPVLGTILLYASTTESMMNGVLLLTSYSLGLGLPLFLTALGVDRFLAYFKQARVYLWGVSTVSGVMLVIVGVMIYANSLTMITGFLERYGIGWYLGQ
jgi:cytochrome c-type biogenesis protein